MLRRSLRLRDWTTLATADTQGNKRVHVSLEVGTWYYTKEVMDAFQRWCRTHEVRAYGNIKITGTPQFARCLRLVKPVRPGQAIITCPSRACFNYLVVARELVDCPSHTFPLELNWMNYDKRLPYLPSSSVHELATVGWMVRIASTAASPFTPYIQYLFEDSRGRAGAGQGISAERSQNDNGMLDTVMGEMAADAGEDPEDFLEHFFRGYAALLMRSQPIEPEAIATYLDGTNFFKAKTRQMFVPTLMPLIDTVPQREDDIHNTVVQYFPYKGRAELRAQYKELQLPLPDEAEDGLVDEVIRTRDGPARKLSTDKGLMSEAMLKDAGFFALRAMSALSEGEVLYLRRYPHITNSQDEALRTKILEADRLNNND